MPFCSRILKAERLQKYYQQGDKIIFGIGPKELVRAKRLCEVYASVGETRKAYPHLIFPLIKEQISPEEIDKWLASTGIAEPMLYRLGFDHNNCSGGCVRAGKRQWLMLLRKLPEVYRERERVEEHMRAVTGKDISFMKTQTLAQLRQQEAEAPYLFPLESDECVSECVGICSHTN